MGTYPQAPSPCVFVRAALLHTVTIRHSHTLKTLPYVRTTPKNMFHMLLKLHVMRNEATVRMYSSLSSQQGR